MVQSTRQREKNYDRGKSGFIEHPLDVLRLDVDGRRI